MEKVLINDSIVSRDDATVDLFDRGYHFGDGIYEVIRVLNGTLFTASEHLDRLYKSAEKVNIKIPYEKDDIRHLIERLVHVNNLETGIVYFQITRGSAVRTHEFPKSKTIPVLSGFTSKFSRPLKELETGVSVTIEEDIRWLNCHIKSLNLLPNVLAKQAATEKNAYEAVLHRKEIVTEASSANVFIVRDKKVLTHPANNLVLNGISRQVVADICKKLQIIFSEKEYTIEDLYTADEVFITSTTAEVMPVIKVGDTIVADGNPGEITRRIQEKFIERMEHETGKQLSF